MLLPPEKDHRPACVPQKSWVFGVGLDQMGEPIDDRLQVGHKGRRSFKIYGGPHPMFLGKDFVVRSPIKVMKQSYYKCLVSSDEKSPCFEAISFGDADLSQLQKGDIFSAIYKPSINNWAGMKSIQLRIIDIEKKEAC